MFGFSSCVVIVTGAAGNLGSAVARAFQAAGAKLVLVERAADRVCRGFSPIWLTQRTTFWHYLLI
jgi:NADP-dependent 3-hydroxy acid dehydrogenase YdfG